MCDKPKDIASPCIRNCCLNTDDICIGCFRSLEEIMQWGSSSLAIKQQVLLISSQRRKQATLQSNLKLL